jgi:hypothetical protein
MLHFRSNRSLEFGNRGLLFPVGVSCLKCREYLDNDLISFNFGGNLIGVEIEDVVSDHSELRDGGINADIQIGVIQFELAKVQVNCCAEVDKSLVVLRISAALFDKGHVEDR